MRKPSKPVLFVTFVAMAAGVAILAAAPRFVAADEPATVSSSPAAASALGHTGTAGEAEGVMNDIPDGTKVHSDVPPPPRDVFVDSTCDFEAWVGKPVDETALKNTGRAYRILKPDDMMTMDHSPERINVEHKDGKVTRVWCG